MSVQTDLRDSYTAEKPGKSENLLSRLNVRSPDPGAPIIRSDRSSLSAGDIAASLALSPPALYEVCKLVDREVALLMLDRLLWFKYTDDTAAGKQLYYILLCDVFTRLLLQEGKSLQSQLRDIKKNRGVMQKCCSLVIDDVCKPSLYSNLGSRAWASKVGVKCHKTWLNSWKGRYLKLRELLQEMDDSIHDQMDRKTS